jgi:organic radical activating enzyme
MQAVRKNLHNGVAIPECHNCNILDNTSALSLRQRYIENSVKFSVPPVLDPMLLGTENWTIKAEDIAVLDLKLGNLCDLKCVMCWGENSSQLLTEYKLHKEKFDNLEPDNTYRPNLSADFRWPLSNEFKLFINRFKNNLRTVKFTGGEPTVVPYVAEFLENIEHPEDLKTVEIITNANSYNKRMFDVLTRFKIVNITISIDGIGNDNEMIRFNSNWKQINENIMRYKAMPNVLVKINHVLQAFSVKTLIPVVQWCESMQLPMAITILDQPRKLRLNTIPIEGITAFKAELVAIRSKIVLNQHVVDGVIKYLDTYKFDAPGLHDRKQYTILLDDLRKTKLSSII